MARLNLVNFNSQRTHEGAAARNISTELELRRSVLACLLWESQFYEDGVEIAGRIAELVPKVAAEKVAAIAVEAREKMKLRHAPLLLVREMARHATHRGLVAETLVRVIQRADDIENIGQNFQRIGELIGGCDQVVRDLPRLERVQEFGHAADLLRGQFRMIVEFRFLLVEALGELLFQLGDLVRVDVDSRNLRIGSETRRCCMPNNVIHAGSENQDQVRIPECR